MSYTKVLLPLIVPDGRYCWEWTGDKSICGHFSNEGGHSVCSLNLGPLKDSEHGVLKGEECLMLEVSHENHQGEKNGTKQQKRSISHKKSKERNGRKK